MPEARIHAFAESPPIGPPGLGLAAPGDEDDAVLALAGRDPHRLALRNAVEVEADIFPARRLRGDVDQPVMGVRMMLTEM